MTEGSGIVEYLVVAGGGGGAAYGGGGAGAVWSGSSTLTADEYLVIVGAGGAKFTGGGAGSDGGASSFNGVTATGGGGGAVGGAGRAGGSGGGAGYDSRLVGPACRGTDMPVGQEAFRSRRTGGGGGGAGGAGGAGTLMQPPLRSVVRAASACSPRSPARHSGTQVVVVDRGCRCRVGSVRWCRWFRRGRRRCLFQQQLDLDCWYATDSQSWWWRWWWASSPTTAHDGADGIVIIRYPI